MQNGSVCEVLIGSCAIELHTLYIMRDCLYTHIHEGEKNVVKDIVKSFKATGKKVIHYGEVLFDIFNSTPYIGGSPTNTCSHLTKLGTQCSLVSCVGRDELGDRGISTLNRSGVDTQYIGRDTHPTGTVIVKVNSFGIPQYNIIKDVAYDYIKLKPEDINRIKETGYDALFFGTMHQRGEASRETLRQIIRSVPFAVRYLDVNLREGFYNKEIIMYSLQNCTILKLNQEELIILQRMFGLNGDDAAYDLINKYPDMDIVLVTKGADGVSLYAKNNRQDISGIPVKVVDTVGSGDAFSAAFLHVYLNTGDIVLALKAGNVLGAYVATCRGAVPDYTDDLKNKLSKML